MAAVPDAVIPVAVLVDAQAATAVTPLAAVRDWSVVCLDLVPTVAAEVAVAAEAEAVIQAREVAVAPAEVEDSA